MLKPGSATSSASSSANNNGLAPAAEPDSPAALHDLPAAMVSQPELDLTDMFAQINLTHLALMEKNQSNSTTNGAFNFQNFHTNLNGNLNLNNLNLSSMNMNNLDSLIGRGGAFLHSPSNQPTTSEEHLASLMSAAGELNNNNPLAINNNLTVNANLNHSLQFGDASMLSSQSLHSPGYAIGHVGLPSPTGLFAHNSLPRSTPSIANTTTNTTTTYSSVLSQQPSLHLQQQQQPNLPNLSNSAATVGSRMLTASAAPGSAHHQAAGHQPSRARPHCVQIKTKFGRLGQGNGQLSSPHGFCLGADEEIIIADTFNHRICIFDKNATYKDQFGKQGKDDGHLWYPRKVSCCFRN